MLLQIACPDFMPVASASGTGSGRWSVQTCEVRLPDGSWAKDGEFEPDRETIELLVIIDVTCEKLNPEPAS